MTVVKNHRIGCVDFERISSCSSNIRVVYDSGSANGVVCSSGLT